MIFSLGELGARLERVEVDYFEEWQRFVWLIRLLSYAASNVTCIMLVESQHEDENIFRLVSSISDY